MTGLRLKRGGARNRADRTSWQLTEHDCRKLLWSSEAAIRSGLPYSRFITLAWGLGGIPAEDSVTATGDFIKLARQWHNNHGQLMPWAWVQERGSRFGQHVHILLHVLGELEPLFRLMPRRWVKQILGGQYVPGVLQSQRLALAYSLETSREAYEAQILGKLHYMLKCAPAGLEGPFGMLGRGHKPWGQSCFVVGKRAGVWQGWKQALIDCPPEFQAAPNTQNFQMI